MRRRIVAVAAIALLTFMAAAAPAQTRTRPAAVQLRIDGDVAIVVKSLPCKVIAPEGGTLFDWGLPDSVTATAEDNVLTITAAPKGTFKVQVRITTIDFEAKKVTRQTGSIEVNYGPPAPPPPPPPTDPLTLALQKAYDADQDSDRAASLAFLQQAYAGMAQQAPSRTEKTNAQFVAWMKTVVESPSAGLKATQLRALRTAIGVELAASWGSTPAPLAPSDAASELRKISQALSGVR